MSRLLHDMSQMKHLMRRGVLPPTYARTVAEYRRLLHARGAIGSTSGYTSESDWQLGIDDLLKIAPFYRRVLHLAECPRLDGPALNQTVDFTAAEEEFLARRNEMPYVVIDDLLSEAALALLWTYCLDSTIWHNDAQMGRNYIGAYRETGLYTPLIEQIITEVEERLARAINGESLAEIWAYRHIFGEMAIGAHADFSAVNLNLWITPDAANRRPSAGGLVLYDKRCPTDWGFEEYNADKKGIQRQLQDVRRVRIPYRCNRAVLFAADLFHASDEVDFGLGYNERRINVTLLFGNRGA